MKPIQLISFDLNKSSSHPLTQNSNSKHKQLPGSNQFRPTKPLESLQLWASTELVKVTSSIEFYLIKIADSKSDPPSMLVRKDYGFGHN